MPDTVPDSTLLAAVFDAYPAPTLLMDGDVQVLHMNVAAREALAPEPSAPVLLRRAGDALHCVNAVDTPGSCTHLEACHDCVLRRAVQEAWASGAVRRRRAFLRVRKAGGEGDAHFLVSAAPITHAGRRLVIVTLEDVSEIVTLRAMIPVCSRCRRVRTEQNVWERIEAYFKERMDVDFSNTICEACLGRYLPEAEEDAGRRPEGAGPSRT